MSFSVCLCQKCLEHCWQIWLFSFTESLPLPGSWEGFYLCDGVWLNNPPRKNKSSGGVTGSPLSVQKIVYPGCLFSFSTTLITQMQTMGGNLLIYVFIYTKLMQLGSNLSIKFDKHWSLNRRRFYMLSFGRAKKWLEEIRSFNAFRYKIFKINCIGYKII